MAKTSDDASFVRISPRSPFSKDHVIMVEHMDGNMTVFGSQITYDIFKRGLVGTGFTLWDDIKQSWEVE